MKEKWGTPDSIIARISARESIDSRSLHEVTDNFTIVRIVPCAGEVKLPPVPVDTRWVIPAARMKGDEDRIREGGCEAYLSKPISVAKFLETVRTYAGVA